MSNECTHGQLARSCEICERDARIAELERQLNSAVITIAHCMDPDGDEHIQTIRRVLTLSGEELDRFVDALAAQGKRDAL